MIADRTMDAAVADRPSRPFAPSWLNWLVARIDALPGPTWAAYLVLGVLSVLFSNAQAWVAGIAPLGAFDGALVFWGVFLIALIWVVDYLDGVAGRAFDAFRPALDVTPEAAEELRYRLVVLPARPALALTLVAVVVTPLYYWADPVGSKITDLSPLGLLLRGVSEGFSSAVLLLIIFQLLRQMRMVNAIVASATRVDLFQPGPLYAFSKLTLRTAIALVLLIGTSSVVASPPSLDGSALILWGPWIVGIPALALAAFVLPLLGMHARLVAEKERLQGDAEGRLKGLLATINREVDLGDLSHADAHNKTLATLLQQRDVIGRMPTWPWSPGTFRALITAIFLPLMIFLAQRFLAQLL